VISGPVEVQNASTARRQRRTILADAFKEAWKQGNLATEMKQEEKWPIFQTSSKASEEMKNGAVGSQPGRRTSDLFEEMSGMVTLKRKPKESDGSQNRTNDQLQNLF
jgi:hypothetical protein